MQPIEIEAKSVEEAIKIACERLKLSQEELEVEVLAQGSSGIFGLVGVRMAKIRAWPKTKGPEEGEAAQERLKEAKSILIGILAHFNLKTEVTERIEGERLFLMIKTDSPAILIGKKAQTLEAFQFLINAIMGRRLGRRSRIVVDVEGYRDKKRREGETQKRPGSLQGQGETKGPAT